MASSKSVADNGAFLPRLPKKVTKGLVAAHLICAFLTLSLVMSLYHFDNATDAMAFYGVYHRNPWNQLIHFFGVPLLVVTLFLGQAHLVLSSSVVLRMPACPPHYITWATVWLVLYILFYASIDVLGTVLYAPVLYTFYAIACNCVQRDQLLQMKKTSGDINRDYDQYCSWTGTGKILQWAALGQLVGLYVQIHPGHKIFEGSQPALAESLGGALSTAPLFAFYEGIWFAGLHQDFRQQVFDQVTLLTQQLCASGLRREPVLDQTDRQTDRLYR